MTKKNEFDQEKKIISISRVKSIDTARGYATIMMVIGHYIQWYLKTDVPSSFLPYLATPSFVQYLFVSILGISAQNLFVTLPAMGVVLQQYIYKQKNMDENTLRKSIIKRGLLLILAQFFCNVIFSDPGYTWAWFILSFIGVSIIITYFITKFSYRARIIIVIAIIMLSPFLKYYFFSAFLSLYFYKNSWSIETFIYKMCLQVVFPIFPSIVYPIIGTIYAEKIIEAKRTNSEFELIRNSLICGIILIAAFFLLGNIYSMVNYPDFWLNLPSRLDVLYVFGTNLVILSIFYWFQDWQEKSWKIFEPFSVFGTISLTVFITHFYLFPKFLERILYRGARQSTDFYTIIQFSLILIILYYIYGLYILRNNRKYSIEWLLRRLV
ncbi:MAG: heparan-alpha-glucosaminide N-acetyltransferase domain-containing protein [Promethearchaeota archaeon]